MIVALPPKTSEQRITLSAIPWDAYVAFCDGVGERYIRMTYNQGEMEIMSVSSKHEREKSRLRRVVEVITEELEFDMEYGGSMTCRKEEMLVALEPDECFWIEHANDVMGLEEIDLDRDPPPDLAHEIEISRSMLDRMAIYAALKVPEIWRWDGQSLTVHLLGSKGTYRVSKRSKSFSFLPLDELVSFLNQTSATGVQFTRAFRRLGMRESRLLEKMTLALPGVCLHNRLHRKPSISWRQTMKTGILFLFLAALLLSVPIAEAQDKAPLRIGIIGLDTSHVPAFAGLFNDPKSEGDLAGFKVVAGFPGGSKDVKSSYTRVEMFTKQIQEKYGVEIVNSIDDLVAKVDVVLIESVDGRPHLAQALPVLKAGKKVFIDKPIAGSLADAIMIFEMAQSYKTPVFSSSSLRYATNLRAVKSDPKLGKVLGCVSYSPCELEPHHPDLFWYGVHGVESLYTIMGTGCKSVSRSHTKDTDVVTGIWADGRVGTYRGLRGGKIEYGTVVFGDKGIMNTNGAVGGYKPLVVEIAKFFKSGVAPVSAAETIEMFAFMEAADESKRQGGAPVTLDSVMQKAREINKNRKLP